MALMRQQSPEKAEDLLRMPTNDFDLVRRLNLSSMLMQRQENQRADRLKSRIIDMGEVVGAFLASSSVGDKSKQTSHNLSRQ